MNQIRLAVIDDHDLFRQGIKLVLGQIDGLEVVYDTADGYQFVEALGRTRIDIALMDVEMPALNGALTTIKALQVKPDLKVIALTMFSDTGHFTQMIKAGVKGFILKKSGKSELQLAISNVYQGNNYFSPDVVTRLAFQNAAPAAGTTRLTNRDMEIMLLMCKGLNSQEISGKLNISLNTAETQRSSIFQKSGVCNTAELIIWAVRNQYFTIE